MRITLTYYLIMSTSLLNDSSINTQTFHMTIWPAGTDLLLVTFNQSRAPFILLVKFFDNIILKITLQWHQIHIYNEQPASPCPQLTYKDNNVPKMDSIMAFLNPVFATIAMHCLVIFFIPYQLQSLNGFPSQTQLMMIKILFDSPSWVWT